MGRRKVRNYKNREYYVNLFHEYFREHTQELLEYTAGVLGFETPRAMRDEEMTGCWCDCGYVIISPTNKEQYREWRLDDGYSAHLYVHNPMYDTQSTSIKEIMVNKMLLDLGLSKDFNVFTRLD